MFSGVGKRLFGRWRRGSRSSTRKVSRALINPLIPRQAWVTRGIEGRQRTRPRGRPLLFRSVR